MHMATTTTQLRVTLSPELQAHLRAKADRLGVNMSTYVKNLIITDIKDEELPTFPMSAATEKVVLQALEEHRQGKTHEITDLDEFLNSL